MRHLKNEPSLAQRETISERRLLLAALSTNPLSPRESLASKPFPLLLAAPFRTTILTPSTQALFVSGGRRSGLYMPRKLKFVKLPYFEGWGCSQCNWVFYPPDFIKGNTMNKITRQFELLRDQAFAAHPCSANLVDTKT